VARLENYSAHFPPPSHPPPPTPNVSLSQLKTYASLGGQVDDARDQCLEGSIYL